MDDLSRRIQHLSPERRQLLEHRLRQNGLSIGLPESAVAPTARGPEARISPLSAVQEHQWQIDQSYPGTALFNIPMLLHLSGELNIPALQQSLNEIIRRHAILRTAFRQIDRQPRQIIAPALSLELALLDLQHIPAAEREQHALRWVAARFKQPFDLTQAPVFTADLVRLAPDTHLLFFRTHYLVFDGWSIRIFHRELFLLYNAFAANQPSPLPELPFQYADLVAQQQLWLTSPAAAAQRAFWQHQLAGMPAIELPADRPRPPVKSFRGERLPLAVPADLIETLRSLSRQEQTTLFITVLAGLFVALRHITGQHDLTIATGISSRELSGAARVIGRFNDTICFRTTVSDAISFQAFLHQVGEVSTTAYTHKELPFYTLLHDLFPDSDPRVPPPLRVSFILDTVRPNSLQLDGLAWKSLAVARDKAVSDLNIGLGELPDGIAGFIEYDTDLFDESSVVGFKTRFLDLLARIPADLHTPVGQLHIT